MIERFIPQKISSRIIALIFFILLANAVLTGIFSLEYHRQLERQKTVQGLDAIISYIEAHGSAQDIDKVLDAYQISVMPEQPKTHVLPANNDVLQKISSHFNKISKDNIVLYEDRHDQNVLYILYTPAQNKPSLWLKMPQEPIKKHGGSIAYIEEFIILFIIFLGSYLTARTINAPLKKIVKSLDAFGADIIPPPVSEEGPTEIKQLAHSVNQMIKNHHALARERELMLAGISHDLRTPLTRLQLLAELSSASPETIEAVKEEVEQITKMQQQFIDYVSASTHETEDWVHLNEFCQDLANKYKLSGQIIEIKSPNDKDIVLQTQPIGLYRILTNAINNAIKYGAPPFSIELSQEKNNILIQVIDHGKGVPAISLTDIFKPLYRGSDSRKNADGSGLGLAIVSRIVKRLGGSIRAYNMAPNGFCIEIQLPRTL